MIIDLIKSYTADTTTVASFSVGSFTLDCQLEESHESNLTVTENPMESGALSSDHSYLEPKRYGVRGIIVNYEPFALAQSLPGADNLDLLKSLPLPLGVGAAIDQAQATINRYAGQVLNAVDKIQSVATKLGRFLPDSLGWLGDEAPSANRFEKIYADLLSIQASGELLVVTSGLMTYNNLLLIGVAANRGTDDSVELSLSFKEVHVVETRTVSGLVVNVPSQQKAADAKSKPEGNKKTGRSADQAAKPKAKGKTNPTKQAPQKQQSLLKKMVG